MLTSCAAFRAKALDAAVGEQLIANQSDLQEEVAKEDGLRSIARCQKHAKLHSSPDHDAMSCLRTDVT
jgi:hypothetical protein